MCDKALVKTTGGVEFYSCCRDGTPCHCQAKVNPVFGTVKRSNNMYINSIEHLKTYLRQNGYEIVDDNKQYAKVRPHLIVWHRKSDAMVYVDFKMLANRHTTYYKYPWYRNWLHKILVCRQFRRWLRENRWRGRHRFDVATVFEATEYNVKPVIDHIVDVKM